MFVRKALVMGVVAALAAGMRPIAAEQVNEPAPPDLKVEVTGSRIPSIDGMNALPVQVIGRQEIDRAGWTTTAELVAHISANMNGFNDQLSANSDDVSGKAFANLRNLGEPSTLILLNGRRLANYAYSNVAVDLNSIPLAALDRVEILKDGASSVYGTDAIAGVINFITRKDYQGFDAILNGEATQQGGAAHQQVTLTGGHGDLAKDRYNAFLTFDWQKNSALPGRDRAFSSNSYRPDLGDTSGLSNSTFPANLYDVDGNILSPALAIGCAPPASVPTIKHHGPQCGYNYATALDDIPATERVNVLGRATFQLSPDTQLYAEYLYTWNDLLQRAAPSPVNNESPVPGGIMYYPANGPYYPTDFANANGLAGDLALAYRTVALGPRTTEFQTDAQRAVLGVQGDWGDWSYDAGYLYSDNTAHTTFVSGIVSASGLDSALYTGHINPFGPSGANGNALLASTQITGQVRHAQGTVNQIDAHASKNLFDMAGGAAALALGAEARREQLSDDPGAVLASGDVLGGVTPVQPQSASRNVYAVYAESILPVSKTVEAQLSVRYDHYSDFGGTTNPKLAVRWQPLKTFLVRGSMGTGFRAPALPEVYTPRFETPDGGEGPDPIRCPVTGADGDCYPAFYAINGGNPALQPEKSTQYTAGIVWEPVRGNSLSLNYWNIDKRNAISLINPGFVLANYNYFAATNVIRGPVDPAYPNLPGPIIAVNAYPLNIGEVHTTGVDVDIAANSPVMSWGQLSLRMDGTFVTLYEVTLPAQATQSSLGAYGVNGPVPRWKHYGTLTWALGAWSATAGQTFQTSYTDENTLNGKPRSVGSYSVWDLQTSYSGLRNLTLTAGLHNLFNRDPPASNQNSQTQAGYDPLYGDPRGLSYYLTVHYAFK